ncbi:Bifunctional protein GlmU [Armadillidium nasatum]|uniref:Bifunctional protein GlmU n=1 Tax=Armadillidium nasatum TaxID=96803 RepID=A0A5N5SYW4_9CRUS|nr:Bifunctional protein GlmU [Armadillidium nasatum]
MISNIKAHMLRLTPGEEVKSSLENYVNNNAPNGCYVLSCCGSVTKATLRFAANEDSTPSKIETLNKHYEVLALNGTVSARGTHLHICLSDNNGGTIGGHVMGDLVVFTTMELMLGEPTDVVLSREDDAATGYDELTLKKK